MHSLLNLNQVGTGNRDVVTIPEAREKRKRLQFFLLVSLRRAIDWHVHIKIADTEARDGALNAATGSDAGDDDASFTRSQA